MFFLVYIVAHLVNSGAFPETPLQPSITKQLAAVSDDDASRHPGQRLEQPPTNPRAGGYQRPGRGEVDSCEVGQSCRQRQQCADKPGKNVGLCASRSICNPWPD